MRSCPSGQRHVAHLRHPPGVADGPRDALEEGPHLGRRLEVELLGLEAHAVGRVEVGGRADAQQHVVGLGLRAMDVVQVVRAHQRDADLRAQADELLGQAALLRQPVVLHLQEEVVRAQDVAVLAGQVAGELPVIHLEGARDLAVEARRQPDEALRVAGQVLAVDARLVVVAVEVGVGDDAAEVLVAGPVPRQEDQVVGLGVGLALAVGHRPPRDVRLDPDERLDLPRPARLVEGDRPVQRAVIGDGQAVETLRAGLPDQVVDAPQPVEQAELRVDVEMGEIVRGDRHGRVNGSRANLKTPTKRGPCASLVATPEEAPQETAASIVPGRPITGVQRRLVERPRVLARLARVAFSPPSQVRLAVDKGELVAVVVDDEARLAVRQPVDPDCLLPVPGNPVVVPICREDRPIRHAGSGVEVRAVGVEGVRDRADPADLAAIARRAGRPRAARPRQAHRVEAAFAAVVWTAVRHARTIAPALSFGQGPNCPSPRLRGMEAAEPIGPPSWRVRVVRRCENSHPLTRGAAKKHSGRWSSRGVSGSRAGRWAILVTPRDWNRVPANSHLWAVSVHCRHLVGQPCRTERCAGQNSGRRVQTPTY